MGNPMDPRRLSGPSPDRGFGRRASDAARCYAATFVAQVAGLSLPARPQLGRYDAPAPTPPKGLVTNFKA